MKHDGESDHPSGRAVLSEPEWEAIGEMLGLSNDYLEIVKGIFDDHTKQRIAADVRVTEHAIDMRMRYLYMHLGVHSRPQLIVKIFTAYKAMQLT